MSERVEQMKKNEESKHLERDKILDKDDGNHLISHLIRKQIPSAIWKIGVNELKFITMTKGYIVKNWDNLRFNGKYRAGVFPDTNEIYEKLGNYYCDLVKDIDVVGLYFNDKEVDFVNDYMNATAVRPPAITSPWMFKYPWSQKLKGKILIAHPFINTIKHQFKNKDKIWNELLPDFNIEFLQIPQNAGVEKPKFNNWFETKDYLLKELEKKEFDIILVGAGAWSLPLVVKAKQMGKIGIHMGGTLQLLFGIKGSKWEENKDITSLYNEYWINLLKEDMPKDVSSVPIWDKYW